MKFAYACALLASLTLGLSACNKAESPDKAQTDVAKAQADAAADNAKADADRKAAEAQATQDMVKAKADAQTQAVDKSIAAVADDAVKEAENDNKVALAKCEALNGDAQKTCKDQANAHLQQVKDRANAAKSNGKAADKGTDKSKG